MRSRCRCRAGSRRPYRRPNTRLSIQIYIYINIYTDSTYMGHTGRLESVTAEGRKTTSMDVKHERNSHCGSFALPTPPFFSCFRRWRRGKCKSETIIAYSSSLSSVNVVHTSFSSFGNVLGKMFENELWREEIF